MENNKINIDNLRLSSIGRRGAAFLIDETLVSIIVILIYSSGLESYSTNPDLLAEFLINVIVLPLMIIKIIYQAFFVWYFGATVGKFLMKIKVIDANNFGKISLISSFTRAVFRVVSEMLYYIGFIFAFFNNGRKTLHDYLGKTVVVYA